MHQEIQISDFRLPNKLCDKSAVLITGPTASGKSALALLIAKANRGIVINADSMQVYSCWRILTARPSEEDELVLPHYLYGHVAHDQAYSVGDWLHEVGEVLREKRRLAVIVGGTGLYFKALTEGLAPIPQIDSNIRAEGQRLLAKSGPEKLLANLQTDDPQTFRSIDHRNPARVLRAWEVFKSTGIGLAAWHQKTAPPLLPLAKCHALLLDPDAAQTAKQAEFRLRRMLKLGVLNECRAALTGWSPDHPSSKAIGAAEFIALLQNRKTKTVALAEVLTATKQYAKRQRTWFRRYMKDWQSVTICR